MKKVDLQKVKANNRGLILSCIADGAVSRAEIVKKTGLSKAAVTLIINDFIEEGRVVEKGVDNSHCVGRPAISLELVPDYCYAVGFSLHRQSVSVCIVNYKIELVDQTTLPTDMFAGADEVLDRMWAELERMMNIHGITNEKLIGVGVVTPGPFDCKNGVIISPPNFKMFHDYNIKEYFAKKTNLPVYLDKDSALLSITDLNMREAKLKNSLFIAIFDNGVGSALTSNGEVYRGFSGYTGELGHTCIDADGPLCACGNYGCLEEVISLKNLHKKFDMSYNYTELIDKWYAGEPRAVSAMEFVAKCLSIAILNAVNYTVIDTVVIHGEFNYRHERLFKIIEQYINTHSLIAKIRPIKVLPSLITSEERISFCTAAIMKAHFEQRL